MIDAPRPAHLTARRHPELDTIELIDWTPGPAGVAVAELADDEIRVLVDYARPARFCSLEHRVGHPGAPALYDALTDGHGAEVTAAVDLLDAQPQVVWRHPRRAVDLDRRGRAPEDTSGSPLLRGIADLAISRSDLMSIVHAPTAEALLRLHCIACEVGLPRELRSSPGASSAELSSVLDAIEALLAAGALDSLTMADHDSLTADLAACARSAAGGELVSRRIERLLPRVRSLADRPESVGYLAAVALPPVPAAMLADARIGHDQAAALAEPPLEMDVRLVDVDGVDVISSAIDGPELHVAIATADESRCWLRVFQRRGPRPAHDRHPHLIALAPFTANEFGSAIAVALLPASSDVAELVVEVTTRPTDAWSDDSALLIKQAVGLGQIAARHEREGADDEAADHWTTCAQAWAAVGDAQRSNLARIYASEADDPFGTPRRRVIESQRPLRRGP